MSDNNNEEIDDICSLCPRKCGIDRKTEKGFCGGEGFPKLKAARAMLHFGEEPCISGKNGSGAVFFSGCTLKCVYCQNTPISAENKGKLIDVNRLAEIFLELQEQGANNINLVSPTHYTRQILAALEIAGDRLHIPAVWNTGGYERAETIKTLDGRIKIFLTDMKYFSPELSGKYSAAGDYFEYAVSGLAEMLRIAGKPVIDENGVMKSGVIVRHLILPGGYHDSIRILEELSERFGNDAFLLSLMSQYTPCYGAEKYKELSRRLTTFEYRKVVDRASDLGFGGFMQEKSSATLEMTPLFDLSGI